MFEDVCLVCGRHLHDDGRAYCSNDCENADTSSPSISSTSSAISSPHLGHGVEGDVPALPPSALGTAFKRHRHRERYSVSSSSASSASWSVPTDDEDEEPALGVNIENNPTDGSEHPHDVNLKSTTNGHSLWSAALSYARLPSGTNNRSTVPHLHKRTPSGSPGHVRGTPQSAPIRSHSSADDEEGYSDFAFPSRDGSDPVETHHSLQPDGSGTARSKRTRNRASLPACFSLLQVSNPAHEARHSPVSSSSGHTIARASPPTPKLVLSTGVVHAQVQMTSLAQGDAIQVTPRGRRRVPGTSRTSRRSGESSSPSPSLSRMHRNVPFPDMLLQRPEIRGASRHPTNWSSDPCAGRGRNTFRRNVSPPPNSHLDDHLTSKARARGRLRAEELDKFSPEAPGFGNGRSGLMNRERGRPTLYY